MPVAGLENTTGTRLFISNGELVMTSTALRAATWAEIVGLVSMGPWGDSVADVAEGAVSEDRVLHTNGTRDGGIVALVIQHRTTDPGTALMLTGTAANLNNFYTFRKVYKSGDVEVASGLLTPLKSRPVAGNSVRGWTCDAKINSDMVRFTAAAYAA